MNAFPALFQPIRIGPVNINNRIAMAPMSVGYMVDPDGSLNQRVVDYYLERARSGVGMIICACFIVENEITGIEESAERIMESGLGYLGELCDAAHSYGTKIFVQLTAGYGRVTWPSTVRRQPVSASTQPNFWDAGITCRALTIEEIKKIVNAMGDAAEKLTVAKVDGVEFHAHEGYLFDQFTTSLWNHRTDQYGGSLENRLRFSIECLQEIRQRVGNRLAVQYRFGLKHYLKDAHYGALPGETFEEVGRDVEEGLQMARMLEAAGFDALHVDAGCYESWYWPHPPIHQQHGCMVDMAARVKEVVTVPVIAVGRLDVPALAYQVIEEKKADMVALGRGLLADPQWVSKVRSNQVERIRPCVACYDGCFARYEGHRPISCAVNPAAGRERSYRLTPAADPKKIAVIGGGIAGMEFARVAAARGHQVTLFEKNAELGGTVVKAAVPAFKKDLRRLLAWYRRQMSHDGIRLRLQTAADLDLLKELQPDVVVAATGATPVIPPIPGVDRELVATSVDLLAEKFSCGKSVIIIGGGLVGCEMAIWLSQLGKKTTIIEMLPDVMAGDVFVPHQVRLMTMDLLKFFKVPILTATTVCEIEAKAVKISSKDSTVRTLPADTVALAVGMAADQALYQHLCRRFDSVYAIGDCRKAQNVMHAVWDAYEIARDV